MHTPYWEATVAHGVLHRARVNGVELREILTPEYAKLFTPADSAGGLGILVGACEGVFSDAEFMRLAEAP